jgi:hypothetical protein
MSPLQDVKSATASRLVIVPVADLPGDVELIDAERGYPALPDTEENWGQVQGHIRLSGKPMRVFRCVLDRTWWVVLAEATALVSTNELADSEPSLPLLCLAHLEAKAPGVLRRIHGKDGPAPWFGTVAYAVDASRQVFFYRPLDLACGFGPRVVLLGESGRDSAWSASSGRCYYDPRVSSVAARLSAACAWALGCSLQSSAAVARDADCWWLLVTDVDGSHRAMSWSVLTGRAIFPGGRAPAVPGNLPSVGAFLCELTLALAEQIRDVGAPVDSEHDTLPAEIARLRLSNGGPTEAVAAGQLPELLATVPGDLPGLLERGADVFALPCPVRGIPWPDADERCVLVRLSTSDGRHTICSENGDRYLVPAELLLLDLTSMANRYKLSRWIRDRWRSAEETDNNRFNVNRAALFGWEMPPRDIDCLARLALQVAGRSAPNEGSHV